jgi:Na+-translocating ferredoxin:NAD+ oxidoreductase RnfA subunit
MPVARWVQYAVLLVLVAVPVSIPGLQTTSYGGWPAVGVAVALFLAAGRRDRWAVMVVATLVAGTALAFSYDVAVWLGWLGGLSVILPSLLTAHLLDPSGRG